MDGLRSWLEDAIAGSRTPGRPLVTVTYAQSLDGCLALDAGQPTALSGAESRRLTHILRAAHDAILVGVGTLLADDPQLNVRLVEGRDPQPVILDSRLRTPLACRLLQRPENLPWLATVGPLDAARCAALEACGARVLELPPGADGRVSLPHLLARLEEMGVRSLMVEGGAAVLTSFLSQRLADLAVVTIAPVFLGGLHVLTNPPAVGGRVPALERPHSFALGEDVILYGRLAEREL